MVPNSKECLRPFPEHQAPKPARADISVGQNQPAPLPGYLRGNAPAFLRNKVLVKYAFFPALSNLAYRSGSNGLILLPGPSARAQPARPHSTRFGGS